MGRIGRGGGEEEKKVVGGAEKGSARGEGEERK